MAKSARLSYLMATDTEGKDLQQADYFEQLHAWYQTDLGQYVYRAEAGELEHCLPDFVGYHIVQVGGGTDLAWLAPSPIRQRTLINHQQANGVLGQQIAASFMRLPLQPNSVDVVLLPHVLEFVEAPEVVLQQAAQALIASGRLLILGFNPGSLWGVARWFKGSGGGMPWNGCFHSLYRIRRWLAKLDCTIDSYKVFCYRVPRQSPSMQEHWSYMDSLGQTIWPTLGGIYLIVARKSLTPVDPVPVRQTLQSIPAKGRIIEPTTRS